MYRVAAVTETAGQVLVFALGVGLSPIPIVAIVLVLASPHATPKALAFLVGWVVGLAALAALLLVLANAGGDGRGEPADWLNAVMLVLGLILLWLALGQWRGRPRTGEVPELPRWMASIDGLTPARAGLTGAGLAALNPKNLVLALGAVAAIAQADVPDGEQGAALALFVGVGTVGVAAPIVVHTLLQDRATRLLDRLRVWMTRRNAIIMAVLLALIGAKLVYDGVSGLTG